MLYLNYCIKKTILFIFMLTSLAACQQVPTQDVSTNASDYSQITAEELLSLFDKKLMLDGNYLTVSADGSFSGTWNNEPMGGTWKMENDYFCRVLTQFSKPENTGIEDCQVWEIKDDNVRGTRDRGKGSSFVYTIMQ